MVACTDEVATIFNEHGFEQPERHSIGTVQIKTTSAWNASEFKDDWPLHYKVQCQHELNVSGVNWGLMAVLVGGQKMANLPFHKNDSFCDALIEGEAGV